MWSDPIKELIATFGRLIDDVLPETATSQDLVIYRRMHAEALRHRELENKTGKVGFEATCA